MPVTNGSTPVAPDGGQSNHAGTLLDGALLALADDPPDDLDGVAPDAFGAAPAAPPAPAAEPPEVDPVAAAPVVVAEVA